MTRKFLRHHKQISTQMIIYGNFVHNNSSQTFHNIQLGGDQLMFILCKKQSFNHQCKNIWCVDLIITKGLHKSTSAN